MRDSTGLRDLALHLEDQAARLHEMGYPEWASHIGADASCLLRRAERLAHAEPPQTGIGSLAGMRDSTVVRDVAHHLERAATQLRELGYIGWAVRLSEDAAYLLEHAKCLAHVEPPLPGVESLAGIDLGFGPAETENPRSTPPEHQHCCCVGGLREALDEMLDSTQPDSTMADGFAARREARAALKQGEDGSG